MTREATARELWLWLSRESVAFDEPVIVRRITAALAAERKATLEEVRAILFDHKLQDLNASHLPETCPYCQAWAEIRALGEKP